MSFSTSLPAFGRGASSAGERRVLANALRMLSVDAVERARSGHPGMPLGLADAAEVLWNDFLRHNPAHPDWPNRDRFVLSNGHGSMLLYALLHLSGYDLSLDELRRFRRLGSKTPGHPEYGVTPGVEVTTGPLGQGLANAVGMAIAERALAARYNRPVFPIIDHRVYVVVGDGCLMEGISHEACSLAGVLGLSKLIVLYDNNQVSIDGDVRGWFADDTAARFRAYRWNVLEAVDGHNSTAVGAALRAAQAEEDRPSLICLETVIGWGAPNKQGTAACHGAPLGAEEVAQTRRRLEWPRAPFEVPASCYAAWNARECGERLEAAWRQLLADYTKQYPGPASELERRLRARLPADWSETAERFISSVAAQPGAAAATRAHSKTCLDAYGPVLPELLGGSADLTESNQTFWSSCSVQDASRPGGNYLHYGVREFAMAAINNGLALHGGFIPYGGTFLVFSDYARNALRMAAIMGLRNIFVFTHDSIGLGEDGPTHQAVEHAASLRLMPNLDVWRPADLLETAVAWRAALERSSGPSVLLLSRQTPLPTPQSPDAALVGRGGYVLMDCEGEPRLIIIATGSEVGLAVAATKHLHAQKRRVRLVSMPCAELFDRQPAAYRDKVLPPHCRLRLAVEAGVSDYWRRYVGLRGRVLGLDRYGESAPGKELFEHFGFTVQRICELVEQPWEGEQAVPEEPRR